MNNRMQERISTFAKDKVIFDFFPEVDIADGADENAQELSGREAPLHAGALCLYATLLMTKLHETDPMSLQPQIKDRREALKTLTKADAKYCSKSEQEINEIVDDMIKVDIRNSFAHGNFEINYDIYTGKMNFVLHPLRRDLITNEPIIIDKNSVLKANQAFLAKKGEEYQFKMIFSETMFNDAVSAGLSKTLKGFILPVQMQKMADYYLGKKPLMKSQVLIDEKMYYLIQYVLASAKITYEQQDYYDIFGKDSNVFGAISLIRNSLAHDNMEFVNNATGASYVDKHVSKTESIAESATKLLIADSQKEIIKTMQKDGKHSEQAIDGLKDELKKMFDFFFDGTYKFEDVASAYIEIDENSKEQKGQERE